MRRLTTGQWIVLLFAVVSTIAFVTGIHGFDRTSGFLRYHGWERLLPLVAAVFCFAWLVGLHIRLIWAWYIGCVLLIIVIAQFFIVQGVLTFLQDRATFLGWWALISQTLVALAVLFILKKWWIPKKGEFRSSRGF